MQRIFPGAFAGLALLALSVTSAAADTCTSSGGLNGTGNPCLPNTVYTNVPDPTSNGGVQDKSLNGSPLLAKYGPDGIFDDGIASYSGDFLVNVTTYNGTDAIGGTWTYTPDVGALYPKYVLVSSGSDWFFYQLAATLAAVTSGTWSTSLLGGQNLSHIAFFDGQLPPSVGDEVPLPGAFLLMGTVLGAGGLAGWRKRRRQGAAAAAV